MAARTKATSAAAAPGKGGSLISDAKLKQLYTLMVQCRILDERARLLSRQGKLAGRYASSSGKEATIVGAAIDLRRDDWIAPSARDCIASFIKGLPPADIFSQFHPPPRRVHGLTAPPEPDSSLRNIIPPALSVVAQLNIAIGVALAGKWKKKDSVVVVFTGNSSISSAACCETMNFAAAHALPILFVSQSGSSSKPATANYRVNFPIIAVDSNDAVAMYRVTHESTQKARKGAGPTLIEAKPFDPALYPHARNVEFGQSNDPIQKMEDYLTAKGLFNSSWAKSVADKFRNTLDNAIQTSGKSAR